MINNPFISQLEEEISNSHPLGHVRATARYALQLNDADRDSVARKENEAYVMRLVGTYEALVKEK